MATTTNFGWETPDDTDLVKDGAAAIRTLGQAIDTSMMDLEGGTTGQVLSKASNTDMDFTWATPAAGGGWTSIASGSLSTGTLSLTSISTSYKNLRLVVRNMQISTNANVQIRINNISTGNYERIGLSNNISTVTTFANGNATEWITTGATTMKGTAYSASLVVDFPDYTNTTSVKMMQMTSNYEQSTSGEDNTLWAVGSLSVGSGAGLNAITQIDMILSTGTYSTGTYILYGGN